MITRPLTMILNCTFRVAVARTPMAIPMRVDFSPQESNPGPAWRPDSATRTPFRRRRFALRLARGCTAWKTNPAIVSKWVAGLAFGRRGAIIRRDANRREARRLSKPTQDDEHRRNLTTTGRVGTSRTPSSLVPSTPKCCSAHAAAGWVAGPQVSLRGFLNSEP